jgi:hypothetical protein
MSGTSADIVRRLTEIEQRLAQLERMTRPYTAVRARIYGSTQTIANNTVTPLTFTDSRWDTGGMWDSTDPNRLTCRVAGLYAIGGGVRWSANATGIRQLYVLRNNVSIAVQLTNAVTGVGQTTNMAIATHYELAVGDVMQLSVRQTSGGALDIDGALNFSPEFWMTRIV